MKRILFATDFGPTSRAAEETVRVVAAGTGATVVAIHAIEPIDPGNDRDEPFAEFYAQLRARARRELRAVVRRFRQAGVACESRVVVSPRHRAILDTAEREEYDLVAIGSRQPVVGDRLELGTTSHKVFVGARTPLLVVRAIE